MMDHAGGERGGGQAAAQESGTGDGAGGEQDVHGGWKRVEQRERGECLAYAGCVYPYKETVGTFCTSVAATFLKAGFDFLATAGAATEHEPQGRRGERGGRCPECGDHAAQS